MRETKHQFGFTLIELMIVVVIIALLAAIAYPSYSDFVTRSQRADAKAALSQAAQTLERCFTRFGTYNPADANDEDGDGNTAEIAPSCVPPPNSEEDFYDITASYGGAATGTATVFTVTATRDPNEAQSDDSACGNYSLNQAGTRGVTGPKGVDECW